MNFVTTFKIVYYKYDHAILWLNTNDELETILLIVLMECDDKNNNLKVTFQHELLLYDINKMNFLKSTLSPHKGIFYCR